MRLNEQGSWPRKRVKSATTIAGRSKPSGRSESSYGNPLKRRARPVRRGRSSRKCGGPSVR